MLCIQLGADVSSAQQILHQVFGHLHVSIMCLLHHIYIVVVGFWEGSEAIVAQFLQSALVTVTG